MRCVGSRKGSNDQCKATVLRGSRYCRFHDVTRHSELIAAAKKGGLNSRRFFPFANFDVPVTPLEIANALGKVVSALVTGKLAPSIGRVAVSGLSAQLQALQMTAPKPNIPDSPNKPLDFSDLDLDDLDTPERKPSFDIPTKKPVEPLKVVAQKPDVEVIPPSIDYRKLPLPL